VLTIVIMMLAILLLAGIVVVYVAFPHRGANVPGAPWLGDAMAKAADAVPMIDDDTGELAPQNSLFR
jgi:hypothetical protein